MIRRSFVNLLCEHPRTVRDWWVSLLGWEVGYDSDWFVHLHAPEDPQLELGLLRRDHEIVPGSVRSPPTGVLVTVVVDDVDAVHAEAEARGEDVVEPPRDLFYGQRRMLVRDPTGALVDISSECDPDPEFLATLRS